MKRKVIPLRMLTSTGLFLISAQVKKDNPVVSLFATDFNEDVRLYFDREEKKLLANVYDVAFPEKDALMVIEKIDQSSKVKEEVKQC